MFALHLSDALRDRSWQSTIMGLFPGDARFEETARAVGVWGGLIGQGSKRSLLSWRVLRTLAARIEAEGYPIVQANGAGTLKYLATARLLSRGRWRLIYRTIGMPSYWRRDPLRLAAYRWWFRQADLVVAVCRRAGEELVTSVGLPARRITVIPNGVDARPFLQRSPEARARARDAGSASPGDLVIAHVGSLSPEKNHGALIRTASALRDADVPVRLWLIGDGPERSGITRMAREAGLDDQTWIAGVRGDVATLLSGADLFILPSLTEGMPAAVIEAGLSGLAVVAFNVGGTDEVVSDGVTGLLVPAGDEEALQAAALRLARDAGARRAMGEAARAACAQYEIGRVAASYADVYAKILDAHQQAA